MCRRLLVLRQRVGKGRLSRLANALIGARRVCQADGVANRVSGRQPDVIIPVDQIVDVEVDAVAGIHVFDDVLCPVKRIGQPCCKPLRQRLFAQQKQNYLDDDKDDQHGQQDKPDGECGKRGGRDQRKDRHDHDQADRHDDNRRDDVGKCQIRLMRIKATPILDQVVDN